MGLLLGANHAQAACTTKNLGIYGPTADPLIWVLLSETYDPALESISYDPAVHEQVRASGGVGGGGGVVDPNFVVVDPGSKPVDAKYDSGQGGVNNRSTTCLPAVIVTATAPPRGNLPVFRPLYWFGAGSGIIRWLNRTGRTVSVPREKATCNSDMAVVIRESCLALKYSGRGYWSSMLRHSTFDVLFSDGWRELEFVTNSGDGSQCATPIGSCRPYQ